MKKYYDFADQQIQSKLVTMSRGGGITEREREV